MGAIFPLTECLVFEVPGRRIVFVVLAFEFLKAWFLWLFLLFFLFAFRVFLKIMLNSSLSGTA